MRRTRSSYDGLGRRFVHVTTRHPDLIHPAPLHVQYFNVQAIDVELLAYSRNTAKLRQQEAAHGLKALPVNLDIQPLVDFVDVDLAVEDVPPAAFVTHWFAFDVVLVANFADEFFEHVLDRHETGSAAVLVDDNRDLRLLTLKLLQEFRDALTFRNDDGRAKQRRDLPRVVTRVEGHEVLHEH